MFSGELAAVVFGLASALTWGAGDFSGGVASKRAPVFGVLAIGHGVGLVLLIVLALVWGEAIPPAADLAWGLAAGLAGAVGVAALYRALAVGQMGIVAPLSAVLTAALPALFGVLTQGLPGARTLAGFGMALLAIWLIAGTGGAGGARDGLGLALLAGCGFGLFFILVHRAGASAVFWPLVAARAGSFGLVLPLALGKRPFLGGDLRLLVPILLSGALDVAGNAFFVLAGQAGRLDVAAILAALYPASTVLLARYLLGERMSPVQQAGLAFTGCAALLIAA